MPSPHERSRNNVRAGLFVTVTLALALGVILVIGEVWTWFEPTKPYTVTFEVSGGVKNLKPGAEVRVGGVALGKVVAVTPRFDVEQPLEKIDVDFRLNRQVTLYQDAKILASSALLGADAWLDITSVGTPEKGTPADGRLEGMSGAGMLSTLLGPDNQTKTDQILDDLKAITARVNEQTIDKVEELIGTATQVMQEALAIIENIGLDLDRWAPDVREALADARLAAQSLKFAGIELRRSPWKILYTPRKSELEHELLYDAARSFAMAASDLKTASESVQRVMDRHPDRLNEDPQIVERLNAFLLDYLDGYEKAQQRLIDVLLTDEQ